MSLQSDTLLKRVIRDLEHDRIKHDLRNDHTTREVNSWTNMELLENISQALDELLYNELYDIKEKLNGPA